MSYELDYNVYQEQIEELKIILTELGIESLLDVTDPEKKYTIMAKLYLVKASGMDMIFKFEIRKGRIYSSDKDFLLQKIRSYYSETYCILAKEDKEKIEKVKNLEKYIDPGERQKYWYTIAATMVYANKNSEKLGIEKTDEALEEIGKGTGFPIHGEDSIKKIIEELREENLLEN